MIHFNSIVSPYFLQNRVDINNLINSTTCGNGGELVVVTQEKLLTEISTYSSERGECVETVEYFSTYVLTEKNTVQSFLWYYLLQSVCELACCKLHGCVHCLYKRETYLNIPTLSVVYEDTSHTRGFHRYTLSLEIGIPLAGKWTRRLEPLQKRRLEPLQEWRFP